jgi:phage repressor protein C with HTH and peptisase S24 domain
MICSVAMCNAANMTDTPDTPHGRLEWARRRAGYDSAAEFAKAIGIHPTTYRAYENGQNGFAKLAPTIAKRLGVGIEWLLEGDGVQKTELPPAPVRVPVAPDQPIVSTPQSEDAIVIRSVDLSYAMGDGTNLEHYYEEEGVLFDPNFIRALTRASSDKLFLARGDGDSMFPTLINDDQVLIDTTQTTLNQQDRIWACALHGAGMIKRLRVVGEGRVEVRSDNPTVGNREVSAADLRIVGRVIWVGRRV